MGDFVTAMHTKSGLLPQIKESVLSIAEAQAQTLAFIKEHVKDPRSIPLCGNSIGTDRRFLQEYMPELEAYLHYRNVDVSTIKELAKRWYPGLLARAQEKETAHRAMDDIRESIAELIFYRQHLFIAGSEQ
jgi:oligoribonuclease